MIGKIIKSKDKYLKLFQSDNVCEGCYFETENGCDNAHAMMVCSGGVFKPITKQETVDHINKKIASLEVKIELEKKEIRRICNE